MTPSDRAAAQAALNEGRIVYSRLDQIRGPEDAAADILDLWAAAESAMRAMLGGSTLAGQTLVRELRQRGSLNLEQANALASFWDARSRVDDVGYKPTLTDVGFARVGYNELTRAVTESTAGIASAPASTTSSPASSSPYAPPGASAATASAPPAAATSVPASAAALPPAIHKHRRAIDPVWTALGVGGLAVIALVVFLFMHFGSSNYDSQLSSATALMESGKTEAARAAFTKMTHDFPDRGRPHVFLARLSRNEGDNSTAHAELSTAIRLDPTDAKAFREMGLLLLSEKNYDLSRSFLLRAVKADTSDLASQGYLGCALVGLNRAPEADVFFKRAGTGAWSSCATAGAAMNPASAVNPATPAITPNSPAPTKGGLGIP